MKCSCILHKRLELGHVYTVSAEYHMQISAALSASSVLYY